MEALYPQLGEIWARLVVRAVQAYQLDLSILHWDITSLYLSGAYTDSELIRYGYSRDHRPHTKQINLQADIAHRSRVAVGCQVLPGQTADVSTPQRHLQALLCFLARPELGAHPLRYRPRRQAQEADFVPYRGVWRPLQVTVGSSGGAAKPETVYNARVLVVWSAGKARLDAEKRRTYLKRWLEGLENIARQLNQGRYAHRDYGHLSANEALGLCKAQNDAEKQFRAVKGPLAVRPVFLHDDRRIEAPMSPWLSGRSGQSDGQRLRQAGLCPAQPETVARPLGRRSSLIAHPERDTLRLGC